MEAAKSDIISKLQTDILRLQGYKQALANNSLDAGLGAITKAFPNNTFPTGCVHEFLADSREDAAATTGFIAGLLNALTENTGSVLWISANRTLFPPALKNFGLNPDQFIFVDVSKERDVLWATDEALKCGALNAVITELNELSFMNSRRLQLAVEQSQVTGFILRSNLKKINTTACVSRWKITSLSGEIIDNLPGVSFPRWKVELPKIRNGKPGSWNVTWRKNAFHVEQPNIEHRALVQQVG